MTGTRTALAASAVPMVRQRKEEAMSTMGTPHQRRIDGRLTWFRVDTWRAGGALSADTYVCRDGQDMTRGCRSADYTPLCSSCWHNIPHTLAVHEATRKEGHA